MKIGEMASARVLGYCPDRCVARGGGITKDKFAESSRDVESDWRDGSVMNLFAVGPSSARFRVSKVYSCFGFFG